jgi:hypothetical protein
MKFTLPKAKWLNDRIHNCIKEEVKMLYDAGVTQFDTYTDTGYDKKKYMHHC